MIRVCFLAFMALCCSVFSIPIDLDMGPGTKAGYISLPKDRPINNSTYLYIKYALEEFRREGAKFVLLDLDTPGGEVFAALQVAEELKKMDRDYGIPIVALVDDWALSAGALLAYSCRWIGASDQSSMGAAEPVIIGQDGTMSSASEKMVSALRAEFAKAAELYGRNPLLAQAMVDKSLTLVLRHGKITQIFDDKQMQSSDLPIIMEGKLLTLTGRQMREWGVSNFWFSSQGALCGKQAFPSDIQWIEYWNWKVSFFAFLSHPLISSLLFIGLMVGFYGVMQSGGFFSLVLAITSLAFLLISTFAVQIIGVLDVVILLVGIILLFLDIYLISSGFLMGLALILTFGGLFSMLLPPLGGNFFNWESIAFTEWSYRFSLFLSSLFLAILCSALLSRFLLRRKSIMTRLVLGENSASPEQKPLCKKGDVATTVSDLRPFGKVLLGDQICEARSESDFLSKGTAVEVVDILGTTLLVRRKL